MLRFYLRLLLLLVLVGLGTVWLAGEWSLRHNTARTQEYFHQQLRGQVHELRQRLGPLPAAQRPAALAALQPHYGVRLSLRRGQPPDLRAAEREDLLRRGYVQREDFGLLLIPLDADRLRGDWLELNTATDATISADSWLRYLVLPPVAAVALALLLWSGLLWRDLRRLQRQSQRLAGGELGAQVSLPRYSELRELGEQFNTMSREMASMVEQQRALTHAVSHELRTPVARLLFELQLLREARDPAQREALIEALHGDVSELDRLIAELLTLARLEQATDHALAKPVPAGPWLQALLDQAAQESGLRDLDLALELPAEAGAVLLMHELLLRQALLNLLRNACRHARSRVCLRLELPAGGWRLSVEDDGPGIPAEARERVLQPFVRLDESRDRASGGVGLGLSIALRVAQRHGGRLWVEQSGLGGAALRLQWPRPAA